MAFERGHKKIGGRKKGDLNVTTKTQREWLDSVLTDGRDKFAESMRKLPPTEYVKAYLALLPYVTPRQSQSINFDAQLKAEYKRIEQLMESAPDEFVEKVAEKVLQMQNDNI